MGVNVYTPTTAKKDRFRLDAGTDLGAVTVSILTYAADNRDWGEIVTHPMGRWVHPANRRAVNRRLKQIEEIKRTEGAWTGYYCLEPRQWNPKTGRPVDSIRRGDCITLYHHDKLVVWFDCLELPGGEIGRYRYLGGGRWSRVPSGEAVGSV